ncbi:hypothetical protein LCGC14_1879290 [marine sediment metagenome]|uniref:1,4-dihydroxy-6-naphtoate synthase n=1 Tax=marine sediment metagenome TaxID=412755 RepID=A0A0F9IGT3_9ZZZZ
MRTLELGYSPCPNDTFIFHALTHGKIHGKTHGKLPGSACSGQLEFHERLEDVETLNYMALSGRLDITKVSFGVITQVLENYCLLRSGGALGRGCGPLVVAREPVTMRSLKGGTIAIPGANTTAFLLLKLFDPSLGENAVAMAFDLIMDAVKEGQVDAGLIIHEGRFTYKDYGLSQLIDLGQWWEETTGKPIPLGGMIAKRDLGRETLLQVEALIRESLSYAFKDPEAPMDYVRQNAQEMDESVMREHIKLYVNDFSLDLGSEGEDAVRELFRMARERGLVKGVEGNLFIE